MGANARFLFFTGHIQRREVVPTRLQENGREAPSQRSGATTFRGGESVANYLFNFTRKNAARDRPLREQAAQLLRLRLWGIGDRTPNRDLLRDGDRVLVFVGAPEKEFIGHAVLSAGVHEWSRDEAARYPGSWTGGVAFREAETWQHPLGIEAVWSMTTAAATNPKAMFMAGIQAMISEDFDLIVASRHGSGERKKRATVSKERQKSTSRPLVKPQLSNSTAAPKSPFEPSALLDRVYAEAERLKAVVAGASGQKLSEAGTRAHLINRQLEALGYADFDDIEFDAPVESGDFADYVLRCGGRPVAVVEAKRLGAPLGAKEAAQVVKYASVLGVRWGIVTDGRKIRLYDPRVPHVTPENRLVFDLDFAGYADREDFEVRLYPELELLSRDRITDTAGLERRAARQALWGILTSADSDTLGALHEELRSKRLVQFSREVLAEILGEMLG